MPNIGARLKARPFKRQQELKHKRTASRLRVYAGRRASYLKMKLLVLAVFILHYQPQLDALRREQRRVAARPGNVLRKRLQRTREKLLKKQTRLQERMVKVKAKLTAAEERMRVRDFHLRTKATAQCGTVEGFGAETPLDEAQLKALSYSRRYREAYLDAVAEKRRWLVAMAKQNAKPLAQPRAI